MRGIFLNRKFALKSGALNQANFRVKKAGLYFYRKRIDRGVIEVVVERTSFINVITVYWV